MPEEYKDELDTYESATTVLGGVGTGAAAGAVVGGVPGGVIGGIAGGLAGLYDVRRQNDALAQAAAQQEALDDALAKVGLDFDMYLQGLSVKEGQLKQSEQARAAEAAQRAGFNDVDSFALQQEVGQQIAQTAAVERGAALQAAVQASIAQRDSIQRQFMTAQELQNNAMAGQTSAVQSLGQLGGAIAAAQSVKQPAAAQAPTAVQFPAQPTGVQYPGGSPPPTGVQFPDGTMSGARSGAPVWGSGPTPAPAGTPISAPVVPQVAPQATRSAPARKPAVAAPISSGSASVAHPGVATPAGGDPDLHLVEAAFRRDPNVDVRTAQAEREIEGLAFKTETPSDSEAPRIQPDVVTIDAIRAEPDSAARAKMADKAINETFFQADSRFRESFAAGKITVTGDTDTSGRIIIMVNDATVARKLLADAEINEKFAIRSSVGDLN